MARLREWAHRGAEARVDEIRAELAEIRRAFPGLGGARGSRVAIGIAPVKRRRRRKPMSEAQKAAVSRRMKAYWAARRAKRAR